MYFSLYTANDGKTKIDVKLEEGALNEESGTMTHRNIMGSILNRTMVNMFGCPRSRNAHIERKKSKCDYLLSECPTDDQVKAIEARVNEVITAALPVSIEYMSREEAASIVDLSKLPEDAS